MPTADELLYGPSLKLERARHHINDLNAQVEAFLADRPFRLMERSYRKAGKLSYIVKVENPIPPTFSLIIGDAVHNLRTALDQTLFAMAGHIEPKIHFPFPKKAEGLVASIKDGKVKVAGKKIVEAITDLKPYYTGNTGLALVHALDVKDKHRLLILSGQRAVFRARPKGDPLADLINPRIKEFGDLIILDGPEDVELFSVRKSFVLRDLPPSEKEAEPQPVFVITFGEGEILRGMPVLQTLPNMVIDTAEAVERLATAFLHPANDPVT